MRIISFLLLLSCFNCCKVSAQYELPKDDSLLSLLRNKYTSISEDRVNISMELISRHLPGQPIFDSLKNMIINEAETSRNRLLMCNVYYKVAHTYLSFGQRNQFSKKAKNYIDNCISIANESGLEAYKVSSFINYAAFYRIIMEKQKALDYNNQAMALATSIGNDSLLCEAYSSIADTWDELANKLSRFEALLNAREFAERSGKHNLINYIDIAAFYKKTEQFEKSKDYYSLAINKGREWNKWYTVLNAMRGMGQSYVLEHKNEMGLAWYNKGLALTDSLNLAAYKVNLPKNPSKSRFRLIHFSNFSLG